MEDLWFRVHTICLGLLLGTEAPVMTPNGADFFSFSAVGMGGLQEVEVLKSVSYDRNVVQFYGTCVVGDQTMLVLEYMEV